MAAAGAYPCTSCQTSMARYDGRSWHFRGANRSWCREQGQTGWDGNICYVGSVPNDPTSCTLMLTLPPILPIGVERSSFSVANACLEIDYATMDFPTRVRPSASDGWMHIWIKFLYCVL